MATAPGSSVFCEQCGREELAPAERTDSREKLTQDELAAVNEQAMRISDEVTVFGAPGAYEADWWRPEPGEGWGPVERGEFDDVEEADDVSHLA